MKCLVILYFQKKKKESVHRFPLSIVVPVMIIDRILKFRHGGLIKPPIASCSFINFVIGRQSREKMKQEKQGIEVIFHRFIFYGKVYIICVT